MYATILALLISQPPVAPSVPQDVPLSKKQYSLEDAVAAATDDLLRIPEPERTKFRYLSLHTAKDRDSLAFVVSGHVNSLSRNQLLKPLLADGPVMRLALEDYGWSAGLWAKLGDPTFTAPSPKEITSQWVGGVWPDDGKFYAKGAFNVSAKKGDPAPLPIVVGLSRLTGSSVPMVRADWFLYQTSAQDSRSPGYYDFLGIKDENSFRKMLDVDAREEITLWEVVTRSGITLFPRGIARSSARRGGYWLTYDFADTAGLKLRTGLKYTNARDASEQIGFLPNGLPAFLLVDGKGKLQATAPPNIAANGESASNDKRVHVYRSCWQCHANGGLRDINADGFAQAISIDRKGVESAMRVVTGRTSAEYSAALTSLLETYEESEVFSNPKE